jgi:hypothetical protein
MTPTQIFELAREPIPYDLPESTISTRLIEDWAEAEKTVEAEHQARHESGPLAGTSRVNPLTRRLLTDPTSIEVGERHRTIFSAAANLAEFNSIEDLIAVVLTEPALNTSLPPREVARQIRCGIDHVRRRSSPGGNA